MRHIILSIAICCTGNALKAQNVGINGTGAAPVTSAILDIDATNKGVLVPRVLLSATNSNAPIGATVVNSLLVFNTFTGGAAGYTVSPGYYYWNSTTARWVRISSDGDNWRLMGNAGTVETTNFLGTTDGAALRMRTNNFERFEISTGTGTATGTGGRLLAFQDGTPAAPIYSWNTSRNTGLFLPAVSTVALSTAGTERMRFLANGQVVVANTTPFTGDLLSAHGNATNNYAISGYSGSGGTGVYGQASAAGISYGVWGIAQTGGILGAGVRGDNVATTGTGVVGAGNNVMPTVLTNGSGAAFTGSTFGSFNVGQTISSFGVYGLSAGGNGTGVLGVGNGTGAASLTTGSGGAFTGTTVGAYGKGAVVISGTGVVGAGNNVPPYTLPGGGGGAFTGTSYGSLGWATTVASGSGMMGAGNGITVMTPLTTGGGGQFFGNTTGAYGKGYTAATGTGVVGSGNNLVGVLSGVGGGGAFTGTSVGSFSIGTTPVSGVGVVGTGNNQTAIRPAEGAGGAFTSTVQGVYARGLNAVGGHGVVASGNNIPPATTGDGAGGSLRGTQLGALGSAATAADGTGLAGLGNGLGTYGTLPNGSGVAGTGTFFGVYGEATSNVLGAVGAPARAGGYFVSGTGASQTWTYVAAYEGAGVPRKVMGAGTVNTVVRDLEENYVLLSAPEAPENLFQDYGSGQLVNGRATITLDPILSKNILVNEEHPLRVFVQLRSDCNGVYVANETPTGFEVVELMGGSSNATFNWSVTANRANVANSDGVVWNYAEERFPRTTGPQSVSRKEISIDPAAHQQLPQQVLESQEIQTIQLDEAPDSDILDSKEVELRREVQE